MKNNKIENTEHMEVGTQTALAKSHNTLLNKYRNLIFLGVCGMMALPMLFHQSKQPDYNYGNDTEWQAHDNLPVILEIRKEERCGTVRLSGCEKYYANQLYLHISLPNKQEIFKCWFSSKEDGNYVSANTDVLVNTLWGIFGKKGTKIEIDKVTYAVARGEKAISKNGLRYCSIKDIKFKHFSDVEYLAWQITTKGREYKLEEDKELYPKYLEMYKKYFY